MLSTQNHDLIFKETQMQFVFGRAPSEAAHWARTKRAQAIGADRRREIPMKRKTARQTQVAAMPQIQRSLRSYATGPTQRLEAMVLALQRQVDDLVALADKDAKDVSQDRVSFSTTESTCLQSEQGMVGMAGGGTGILACDADQVMINHVRCSGFHSLPASLDVDTSTNNDTVVRHLVVWFYKPLLVADAVGTLPPITEVLVSDDVNSLPVQATANGGRFVILSDKMWNLGVNTYQSAAAAGAAINNGRSKRYFDYTIEVGKMCKFVKHGDATSGPGHYSSTNLDGQIDRGLLVMYSQVSLGVPTCAPTTVMVTRLNFAS